MEKIDNSGLLRDNAGMLKADHLSMNYKKNKVQVLYDISFDIKKGEMVALLGPNGCGKSTLIKCLTGILRPTSGKAYVMNIDSFKHQKRIRNDIGVVFNQKPSFIVDLEVMDNLLYFKAIYNLSDEKFNTMLGLADKYLDISSLYKKPYRKLSFGERVKCEITSVILHNPAVLIFDEPTIGLDYRAKIGFCELLKYLNKEFATTILLITHEFDYMQDVCNKVIIMCDGRVIQEGSIADIMRERKIGYSLTVNYVEVNEQTTFELLKKQALKHDEARGEMRFSCADEDERQTMLEKIVKGVKVTGIKTEKSSFKEVFADVLQKNV